MKAMSQSLHFGKSVMGNAYGMFLNVLEYKLEEQGKKLVKTDRFYPSSKTCCKCGAVKEELKLSDRIYEYSCGNKMDRDVNAAINIRSKEWDEKYGDKPESIREKLELHKQEIREQASERPYRQSKDRGAR